jgi:opacity protein-like surface antigen
MKEAQRTIFAGFAALLLVIPGTGALADDFIGLTWNMALPAGDLKMYADQVSWRGFAFEGRHFFSERWSVGLGLNYSIFHQNADELISIENSDISGAQFRVVYSFPLLATAHYYINWDYYQKVDPYVGMGIGAYRMERRLDIGVSSIRDNNWHLGFAPELGLAVPIDFTRSIYFNVRYNYALEAGGIGPYSYWGFNLGAAWRQ